MKRIIILLTGVMLLMILGGCGKQKYLLYFDGNGFESKHASYAPGEEVSVYYGQVATDTDYSFSCDPDVDMKQEFDGKHGYVFTFTMPFHDVTLHVDSKRGMLMDSGAKPEQTVDDLLAEIDDEKMVFSYQEQTEATPEGGRSCRYALYARDGREDLLLSVSYREDDLEGEDVCPVPAVTLMRCMGIVSRYKMEDRKNGHGPRGKSYSVHFRDANGELIRISSDDMPEDGQSAFSEIEGTLSSAWGQFMIKGKAREPEKNGQADETEEPWVCPECGLENTGKYCSECGHKKP